MNKIWKLANSNLGVGIIILLITTFGLAAIFDIVWQWIKIAFNAVVGFFINIFTYEVAVWIVLLVIAVIIGALVLYVKLQEDIEDITELEKQIIKIYDNNNNFGRSFDIIQIARMLNSNDMLSVEQAILNLAHTTKHLQRHDSFMSDTNTMFTLSGKGRNYILQNFRQ
ncbi:MAG: hypothetical protein A3E21_08775 [Sulfurimonas sp. RIFCSPHIGHO2_12_FULL_36_9]|uniref:hypothetical protein n=1 Tax=Sulfurimonas sp. RIFCSPLOWO2_12_36_12 TaxID=1802253 RepID=UPI0008B969F7|nr:hypothetical protein [Sulfurimonas sp. RIFCSPLOWO2_12_36_12]OHD96609.1 MAG: hypothetical protein A3E21_08775 [Sulfurimonas sp. RIFCSPHIGHO2_12_FULL_36_9]OHD99315.1 MAG: hypothetical protein A3J26_08590 [Sulfurimonas sp. RIFCSPLOWO2_02_FULL_36_28]OHE01258.1 MAG: hypothetical protein A2W82_07860 [Sulfurimonas sp. RIFCSPLOWO2_12_36_12]OHE04988.1 MAG: hypothetical protein A3K14_04905 [Sulfurimonas sp. RIFCSPLOWO2_12_FULL_36_74]